MAIEKHYLGIKNMQKEVIKTIKEIRPLLQADGGDIELIAVDEATGIVKVKLIGACAGCPMSQVTLKEGVEKTLKEKVKGVKEVIAI